MKKSTKKRSVSSKKSVSKKIAIGVGVGLAAAAAAYFLTGTRGKKNRAAIADWMVRAHEELSHAVKRAGALTKREYEQLVRTVTKKYSHLSASELRTLSAALRSHWKTISKK